MSKILRRPMFRGGPVNSRGTGITSGLDEPGYADGGRVGFFRGGYSRIPGIDDLSQVGIYNPFIPANTMMQQRQQRIQEMENRGDPLMDLFTPTTYQKLQREIELNKPRTEQQYEEAVQKGLDITRTKPFEISDESYSKPKTLPTQGGQTVVQKDINEITKDDLQKEVETYSKLLGGDEAKSQAIYDALLAASPAFFKGKNLREAAPEVLTAINKSGAFDKPTNIRQAAAQLAIQRRMLVDKAREEAKTKEELIALGIAGKKKSFGETIGEYLEKGNPISENVLYTAALDKLPNFKGKLYTGQKLEPNSIYLDKLSFYKTDAEGNLIKQPVLDYRSVATTK